MKHLKITSLHPDYEATGRMLKNAFGMDELIVLHKNYWIYFDWLAEQGQDMTEWVVECDKHRGATCLGESLMEWLYWDECDRHRQGHPVPSDTPPLGYVE